MWFCYFCGWGTRMRRGVRRLAGQCLLVKCPDTSRRSCRRKRKGKRGTCRIWPECRCIRAAGGIRICLVRQILPSLPLPFSSTASNACFMDFSPADIAPAGVPHTNPLVDSRTSNSPGSTTFLCCPFFRIMLNSRSIVTFAIFSTG